MAGASQRGSNILTEAMSIAGLCGRRNKQSERAIRTIILSARLHKMTIIHLQGLMGLAIDTHQATIPVPGASTCDSDLVTTERVGGGALISHRGSICHVTERTSMILFKKKNTIQRKAIKQKKKGKPNVF